MRSQKSLTHSIRTRPLYKIFFFFNDTATTEIYTLSLHDALPISRAGRNRTANSTRIAKAIDAGYIQMRGQSCVTRSEEHTSELQSRLHLVCRLLLEKKKVKRQLHTRQLSAHGTALLKSSSAVPNP